VAAGPGVAVADPLGVGAGSDAGELLPVPVAPGAESEEAPGCAVHAGPLPPGALHPAARAPAIRRVAVLSPQDVARLVIQPAYRQMTADPGQEPRVAVGRSPQPRARLGSMRDEHYGTEEVGLADISALDIADWRLRTFALYETVRRIAAEDPAEAHSLWRHERDRMFATHPASALTPEDKAQFSGLKTADYDPVYRFYVPLTPEGAGREMTAETTTDGVIRFIRLGTFDLPELGQLGVWKLHGYGGGIFVPFRDATAGQPGGTYGAGRYLLDTIKGAFHGVQGSGPGAEFVLDFNFAYNPSCAYNDAWACPLPGPSNRLAVEIPVGELY
jgi:uncharacterized protein (DUF1684 family)